MMKKLAFAALAAMSVGACATTGNGSAPARPAVAGAQYCSQERLAEIGTRMNCNWASSVEEACAGNAAFSTIDATPYARHKAWQCANGRWIVQLTPKS